MSYKFSIKRLLQMSYVAGGATELFPYRTEVVWDPGFIFKTPGWLSVDLHSSALSSS